MATGRRSLRDRIWNSQRSGSAARQGQVARQGQGTEDQGDQALPDDVEPRKPADYPDQVLARLNRHIKLHPADAWAFCARGQTYLAMERYDDALADLDRAIELDPGNAWALSARGETHERMGRNDEALADLNHAVDLAPDDPLIFALAARSTGLWTVSTRPWPT